MQREQAEAHESQLPNRGSRMGQLSYVEWVTEWPLVSAAVPFALLGTLGEVLASSIRERKPVLPCTPFQLAGKVVAWALLGVILGAAKPKKAAPVQPGTAR